MPPSPHASDRVCDNDPATQDTTFVGFDLRNLQPDLAQTNLGIEYRDLSQRIQWVHGDLFVLYYQSLPRE